MTGPTATLAAILTLAALASCGDDGRAGSSDTQPVTTAPTSITTDPSVGSTAAPTDTGEQTTAGTTPQTTGPGDPTTTTGEPTTSDPTVTGDPG